MNKTIFVIGHKPFDLITNDSIYKKLLVGRDVPSETIGNDNGLYFFDSTGGDNISYKNQNYCELTGQYWIWKNQHTSKIVGICHYRRYFYTVWNMLKSIFTGRQYPLNDKKIDKILSKYDMIVRMDTPFSRVKIYDYYVKHHNKRDIDITRDVIKDIYPEYLTSFDKTMEECKMYSCNMFICKKDIFDAYSEWLFNVLFELEKRIDISSYDKYQKRVFGFISERLLRVWILKNHIRIRECLVYKLKS